LKQNVDRSYEEETYKRNIGRAPFRTDKLTSYLSLNLNLMRRFRSSSQRFGSLKNTMKYSMSESRIFSMFITQLPGSMVGMGRVQVSAYCKSFLEFQRHAIEWNHRVVVKHGELMFGPATR